MKLVLRSVRAALMLACASELLAATPGDAMPIPFVGIGMLEIMQVASTPNMCVSYGFDPNGNIIARTSGAFGQAVWGSSPYGCFSWTTSSADVGSFSRQLDGSLRYYATRDERRLKGSVALRGKLRTRQA